MNATKDTEDWQKIHNELQQCKTTKEELDKYENFAKNLDRWKHQKDRTAKEAAKWKGFTKAIKRWSVSNQNSYNWEEHEREINERQVRTTVVNPSPKRQK